MTPVIVGTVLAFSSIPHYPSLYFCFHVPGLLLSRVVRVSTYEGGILGEAVGDGTHRRAVSLLETS